MIILNSPIPKGTVYGVVLNDKGSLDRMGAVLSVAPYKAPPQAPVLYIKPAGTVIAGGDIFLPLNADRAEIGATLGIKIGRTASRLTSRSCTSFIESYLTVADLSLPHSNYYRPAIREKCFDRSCVLSDTPALSSNNPQLDKLSIETTINGESVDRWSLQELIRDIPTLLCDVTEFMTLYAGDVLLVGVKWKAPVAMAGDHVTVNIRDIGQIDFDIKNSESRSST